PGQRGLECRRQFGDVVRTKRVVVFEDRSDWHVQPRNRTPHARRNIFYRGGVNDRRPNSNDGARGSRSELLSRCEALEAVPLVRVIFSVTIRIYILTTSRSCAT